MDSWLIDQAIYTSDREKRQFETPSPILVTNHYVTINLSICIITNDTY